MIEIKGILFGTYPLLRKHVLLSEFDHDLTTWRYWNDGEDWGNHPRWRLVSLISTIVSCYSLIKIYLPSGYDSQFAMENPPIFKNGKPSIYFYGPFSMAMLNNQMVDMGL